MIIDGEELFFVDFCNLLTVKNYFLLIFMTRMIKVQKSTKNNSSPDHLR